MRLLPILALCAAVLVSCERTPPAAAPDTGGETATATWPATRPTDGGSFTVTLNPTAGEILNNTHFSLDLSVEPKKALSTSLSVAVDADMPAHRHGMNTKPELVPKGENKFQVDGMLFHMAGKWVITVEVTGGGVKERADFPVVVE